MMMGIDNVLEVENLSKLYSRNPKSTRSRIVKDYIRSLFGRPSKFINDLNSGEFWSLKDINFSIKRGEALGIIGLNGSGKTTLLRILAGQILPDQGEIRILGNTSAMIDLTAGFQMGASGAQNIYLRGAMLGRSKEELEHTFDEIVDFTELGEAIDAPVSTYSSGMKMRLAFSIMVATKPDIMFIDEILSVGDFQFRQKCFSKIRELRSQCGFILVSHSMSDIQNFCDQAILLDKGQVVIKGAPADVVNTYETMKENKPLSENEKRVEILKPQFINNKAIDVIEHHWCDESENLISKINTRDNLFFKIVFKINFIPRKLIIGVPMWKENGDYVTGFSTETQNMKFEVGVKERTEFLLEIPNIPLNPGVYISNLTILDGPEFLIRIANPELKIIKNINPYWGIVSLQHKWKKVQLIKI